MQGAILLVRSNFWVQYLAQGYFNWQPGLQTIDLPITGKHLWSTFSAYPIALCQVSIKFSGPCFPRVES